MVGAINFKSLEDKQNHLESLKNIPSIHAKSYSSDAEYHRLDFISHPKFGFGFVEEVLSEEEIKVFFIKGVKVLKQKDFLTQRVV